MTNVLWLIFLLFMLFLGVWLGIVLNHEASQPKIDILSTDAEETPAEIPDEVEGFTVAGKSRRPKWRQRRQELELAARTKRKKLEEWSD